MNTIYSKSAHYGQKAETTISSRTNYPNRQLNVVTMKRNGGILATTINSVLISEDGRCTSYMPFSDYHKLAIKESVRCTEKSVRQQHEAALAQIDIFLNEEEHFYKNPK